MIVELNPSNLIFLGVAVVGGAWAAAKYIAAIHERATLQSQEFFKLQFAGHEKSELENRELVNRRFDTIEELNRQEATQWHRVERELMALKAEMPLHYVRREDYIRGQSVLEAKVDGVGMKLENALLRAFKTTL
jgi:hypothetical protein